jgi:hypothetical protein
VPGDNVLAARARDRGGESFFDLEVVADQVENLPPDCATVELTPTTLWPPDHRLRTVTASGGTDPEGAPVSLVVTAVTQDEPLDGLGDGDTAPDASRQGVPAHQVRLRAERSGRGDGRVYRVTVTGTDGAGACSTRLPVGVPRDRGKAAVARDTTGVVVDSFGTG